MLGRHCRSCKAGLSQIANLMEIPLDLVTIRYLKLVGIDKDKVAKRGGDKFPRYHLPVLYRSL